MNDNKKLNEKELDEVSGGIIITQIDDINSNVKSQEMNLYEGPNNGPKIAKIKEINELDPTKPLDDSKG